MTGESTWFGLWGTEGGSLRQIPFAFPAIQQYWIRDMFDAIRAQLTAAGEKLAHLRRFL